MRSALRSFVGPSSQQHREVCTRRPVRQLQKPAGLTRRSAQEAADANRRLPPGTCLAAGFHDPFWLLIDRSSATKVSHSVPPWRASVHLPSSSRGVELGHATSPAVGRAENGADDQAMALGERFPMTEARSSHS